MNDYELSSGEYILHLERQNEALLKENKYLTKALVDAHTDHRVTVAVLEEKIYYLKEGLDENGE